MKKIASAVISGSILFCIVLNLFASQISADALDSELFCSAFSAQSNLINLFVCGTLPLKIVSEYFIVQNGMQSHANQTPEKRHKKQSDSSSSAGILHEQKLSEKKLEAKRWVPITGAVTTYSSANYPAAYLGGVITPLLFQQCFVILVMLCIFLLPRSSTDENYAVMLSPV